MKENNRQIDTFVKLRGSVNYLNTLIKNTTKTLYYDLQNYYYTHKWI